MAVSGFKAQEEAASRYRHERWTSRRRFLRFLLRTAGSLLFRVDRIDGMENFPRQGPAILMINHIAFVDPIVMVTITPRFIVPLAKIEVYDYPVIGIFPRLWGVIPIRRGEVDRRAIRLALDVLRAGEIILVAPEGTRNSCLQRGQEGVAYLASRSGAPVVPVAIEHTEGFPSLPILPRWREEGAHVQFGKPFRYRRDYARPDRDQLRQMTDEALYILAAMVPEERRGYYADLSRATQMTVEWV